VVTLGDDRATVTDGDGLYGFYNLRAGDYIVRIELASIDPDAEAAIVEQRASLAADHPMTGLDFRVTIRPRPIVWSDGR
jgi:hypothetical protein